MPSRRSRTGRRNRGSIYLGVAAALFVGSGALVGGYFVTGTGEATVGRANATSSEITDPDTAALSATIEKSLSRTVTVAVGDQTRTLRWSELGVTADPDELARAARTVAKATSDQAAAIDPLALLGERGALPVRLDRDRALAALAHLKAGIDRAPVDARLDLEARTIHDAQVGYAIDLYASLDRIEAAARSGAERAELAGVELPPRVTRAALGIDDISHVLGTFTTRFAVGDKDRNFNLKLAASKLDGVVLQPGVEFSFNDTVGDRTEKEGYKIAHVITKGEMVDGLAGGTCQISTTLFGASFFAGLQIVKTTPHSRPSTYVPMGLDSTVVYPTTDLKLVNPYDFPVVISYRVARGESVVEILGKARPYDKIAFEREILEVTPYDIEERLDDTLAEGSETLDQEGFDGYKVLRFRKYYRDGKVVKTDKWTLQYRPVTEYIRRGTSTDPDAKVPGERKHHGPKPPREGRGRITQ